MTSYIAPGVAKMITELYNGVKFFLTILLINRVGQVSWFG